MEDKNQKKVKWWYEYKQDWPITPTDGLSTGAETVSTLPSSALAQHSVILWSETLNLSEIPTTYFCTRFLFVF